MLPFNAQGAVSAMEDGGALGHLLQDIDDPALVPERLEVFQKARADRVARVQILSNVKLGREKEVEEQVRRYADPRGSSKSTLSLDRMAKTLTYNRCPDKHGRTRCSRLWVSGPVFPKFQALIISDMMCIESATK